MMSLLPKYPWYDSRGLTGRAVMDFGLVSLWVIPVAGWALLDHPKTAMVVIASLGWIYGLGRYCQGFMKGRKQEKFERAWQDIEVFNRCNVYGKPGAVTLKGESST